MKLFRYNQFIKESIEEEVDALLKNVDSPLNVAKLQDLRIEFKKGIIDATSHSSSFSSLASNINRDPDEDFDEIQSELDSLGFNLEYIKKIFSKEVNNVLGDFKSFIEGYVYGNSLDQINGEVDIYLFILNKKLNLNTKVYLGGEGWSDMISTPDTGYPGEEVILKYAYGYHRTKYGKLLLSSINISPEDFIEDAFYHLKRALTEELVYYYETKSFGSWWPIDNIHFGLPSIVVHPDEFRELLNENLITTENSLIINILDLLDELFKDHDDLYEKGKEIIMDVINKWLSSQGGNAFEIVSISLEKIEIIGKN